MSNKIIANDKALENMWKKWNWVLNITTHMKSIARYFLILYPAQFQ